MIINSLNGKWTMRQAGTDEWIDAVVPGCNFIDLEKAGKIPDPLVEMNENLVQWVAQKDWEYKKIFIVDKDFNSKPNKALVFEMLDTICSVYLNGKLIGECNNINRIYRFDISKNVKNGENELRLLFASPFAYIAQQNKENPLPNSTMGEVGSCQLRKAPYHFGWDWAPHLLPCGISRDVSIIAYDGGIFNSLILKQQHERNKVKLEVIGKASESDNVTFEYILSFDGHEVVSSKDSCGAQTLTIDNPHIWWCNGLGAQPLYTLECHIYTDGELTDTRIMNVGLRTIELDTRFDSIGRNFCFVVNKTPIFAKGASWIATDSFINKTTPKQLEEMIIKAKKANFNMLRVWGGAYYESDLFYQLCAKYGILVWQDCNFACSAYPFGNEDFLQNVKFEIEDNVKRLRNQTALCLWAGNNEIESMSIAWLYRKDIIKQTGEFFYNTLPHWIQALDSVTPYWACTPSSGEYMKKVNHDDFGDTHLWHVWHGLRPLEFYRKRFTRFCSEFGIESLPSINALEKFAGTGDLNFDSEVMKLHQKCACGNSKMLYYTLSRYWQPAEFRDMIYMTQIAQMECAREATEHWRRNKGRCNGSLYWQYNDCWGVSSWSGMDYYGNLKALQYMATHFNQSVTLTVENSPTKAIIYAHNDVNTDLDAIVKYGIMTFEGEEICEFDIACQLKAQEVKKLTIFDFSGSVNGGNKDKCFFYAHLIQDGKIISSRTFPIAREKDCQLPKTEIAKHIDVLRGIATITLQSPKYARYVELRLKGISSPFEDNFFDLLPNKIKKVSVEIPLEWREEDVARNLTIQSIVDIKPKNSRFVDKLNRIKIFLKPVNFVNWIARTFDN